MTRFGMIVLAATVGLAGCATTTPIALDPSGRPLPQRYDISAADSGAIVLRMQDGVNAVRQAAGAQPVALNAQLNAAAATHSRDMSVQNRPWHFGSDGSSPLDRVRRVGYAGTLLGENISETYETEVETLAAWMADPATRGVVLDPQAREMGFAWFQEPNGKIWWTLLTGY
ncbi:hypothetical protein OCGS_1475 [Oceaniovalibus guishaninsula JLT2003]|uniref:SCP domain-containing protein n=1 Tax=Oceaniovalibus guishaninsula JLT2003 TaxID=1231392 RepID=K2HDR1_9RHOB|nr:CAP domain-containing protein [Oceaniovalibus guishaninsula]EKE44637.1 hypothetical protein OCGS_1475 [Oceaniovalibus guishaninsula JLT2003]